MVEHPRRYVISIKFQSSFIEIALQHAWSPVNLLHIFRTPFLKKPLDECFCTLTISHKSNLKVKHKKVNTY